MGPIIDFSPFPQYAPQQNPSIQDHLNYACSQVVREVTGRDIEDGMHGHQSVHRTRTTVSSFPP